MPGSTFPAFPEDFEDTRATLHAYAHAVGSIPRAHAIPHPQWWHISLGVRPSGLTTDAMALPGGGTFEVRMDLNRHAVVLATSDGTEQEISMTQGLTGTELGDQLIDLVAELGLEADYAREKFESDEPRPYDPATAGDFFRTLVDVAYLFDTHRATLPPSSVGPVQLWPHGFDLAFEWHGTRVEVYDGESLPSQINLGFYPGGEPYFYSNPWPFEREELLSQPLPPPAIWHTDGWEGSRLGYDDVRSQDDPAAAVIEFAGAVQKAAAPTLTA